jgi:predicted component of type VI protein secretion system
MPTYLLRHRGVIHRITAAETLIGRGDECKLRIEHAKVSRVHAQLRLSGDELELSDLGSMNGTRVNGQRLLGPRRLKSGDVVKLGIETIEVFSDEVPVISTRTPATITAPPTTEPMDDLAAALDTLEVVEAMLASHELGERPLETARTVRTLLDEALESFVAEGTRIDHATAERIARAVSLVGELAPSDTSGPWVDRVAERLKRLLA